MCQLLSPLELTVTSRCAPLPQPPARVLIVADRNDVEAIRARMAVVRAVLQAAAERDLQKAGEAQSLREEVVLAAAAAGIAAGKAAKAADKAS